MVAVKSMVVGTMFVIGCWTGPETPAQTPIAPVSEHGARSLHPYRIEMERTVCFGRCPAYTITIDRDGTAVWEGGSFVAVTGRKASRVGAADLAALERQIDAMRFFELGADGLLPEQVVCTANGKVQTCEFRSSTLCSDTSRSILTVWRGSDKHVVADDHCEDNASLSGLEEMIDQAANTKQWIGR